MIAMMLLATALPQDKHEQCEQAVAQADLTACEIREFNEADRALNRQWPITLASMRVRDKVRRGSSDKRPGDADQLLKAQRAWLSFRDAHCVSAGYSMRGGSAEPMIVASCRAELTRARTRQLEALVGTN